MEPEPGAAWVRELDAGFAGEPVLAPRWRAPGALEAVRAGWRTDGYARMEAALADGLAAELAVTLTRLPLAVVEGADEVIWGAGVTVPDVFDPQLVPSLFRAARLIERVLPALGRAIAGRSLVAVAARTLQVTGYRKGSWTERAALAPAGTIACTIAIVAGAWPPAWGGYDRRGGAAPWLPGPGAIELADAASVRTVELITRSVERLELRALLVPSEAG